MIHRIRIYGIVQGVGFRPTVARHAACYGIRGTVSNKGPFVEIFAEAPYEQLTAFEEAIEKRSPRRAIILKMDIEDLGKRAGEDNTEDIVYGDFSDFQIIESEKTKGEILISPDIAICEDCKREMYEKGNERYLHPFINCTCCGPRLTILDALPYDRVRTSMKAFPMCKSCGEQYVTPKDRRYDAQPVCCNACGPVVYLLDLSKAESSGETQEIAEIKPVGREDDGDVKETITRYQSLFGLSAAELERVRREQPKAIRKVRQTIAQGGIVAIKGIGGYHLCCDATSQKAVSLLRERKKRPMKPFAVMMKDLETVKKNCYVTKEEEEILTGHQKPILLLKKKADSLLCEAVAPDNPKAGVMLPYAPVQLLLFNYEDDIEMPEALLMTSANASGAPICRDEKDALTELGYLCDEILAHNRMIRIRADDTVMDFYDGKPYMIRRSRGYAPLPLMIEDPDKKKSGKDRVILGIGGELKNTFCIRNQNLLYLSPYVGDMEDIRTVKALEETIQRFKTLLEVEIDAVVCDLHPKYNTTELALGLGLPTYKIQHHYAHILSCMAENQVYETVIGVAYDGTGYGSDGSIWGGEILLSDTKDFLRSASIMPFIQVGGDASAREGWRIAVSMLYGLAKKEEPDRKKAREIALKKVAELGLCSEKEAGVIMAMADLSVNAVTSTSAGRLFDSVSALLGIRKCSTFEGEASTSLQFKAEAYIEKLKNKDCRGSGRIYPPGRGEDGRILLPTDRLFADIVAGRLAGEAVEKLAYDFHAGLAAMTVAACEQIRLATGKGKVALSGGCFQNTLLLKLTGDALEEKGFQVLKHSMVPPNDGGLALGQAIYRGMDEKEHV